ncbi:MAG: hypothetical protein ACSHX0_07005 [Akkermansiaceae bacterium]
MKSTIIRIASLLALTSTSLLAHPGLPGHTHPETGDHSEWPFPDFSWGMIIGSAILIGAIAIYKFSKKV